MFGRAHLVHSQRYGRKELILVPAPPKFDSHAYPFSKVRGNRPKANRQIISFYSCYECRKENGRKTKGLQIIQIDGFSKLYLTDPNVNHICGEGIPMNTLRGIEMKRTALAEVLINGTAPTQATVNLTVRIFVKYGQGQDQVRQEIKGAIGNDTNLKKAFQRARAAKYPTVPSYDDIPPELTVSLGPAQHNVIEYFSDVWINGSLGRNFINQFDNHCGPRTTNNAENYHSKQKAMFTRSHPRLGEWLTQFQVVHLKEEDFAEDVRIGRVPPKTRKQRYLDTDSRIVYLKADLWYFLSQSSTPDKYRKKIMKYLSRIGHLIGDGVNK